MITNVSPLDGRYASKTRALSDYFSEYALVKYRVFVELQFLKALAAEPEVDGINSFTNDELTAIDTLMSNFSEEDALRVKEIEKTTNHDVKAVEYFIKENLEGKIPAQAIEFIHFSCTSEDINNLSYSLMTKDGIEKVMLPFMEKVEADVREKANAWKEVSMLSRTHGQTASPTTVGKEFWIFAERLNRQMQFIEGQQYLGKLNGATGNFNAHNAAYPNVDWKSFSNNFVISLGLTPNFATAQIEPHDFHAEIFQAFVRFNTILVDMSRDIWGYVSLGYFKQKLKEGEIGSSAMPHKVNPIDFENAEGNLGLGNAVLSHLAEKLPVSRWQRDLTDSTVMRNIGVGFGYTLIALESLMKGLGKLELNEARTAEDLDNSWEILAEAIQTVMRKNHIDKPYEKLKALTRGKEITQEIVRDFIETLDIEEDDKKRLQDMTPATYTGIANKLVN